MRDILFSNGELKMNTKTLNIDGDFYLKNMSHDAYGIKPIDLLSDKVSRRFEQCRGSFIYRSKYVLA